MAEENINEVIEENQENLEEEDENTILWATLGIGFAIDVFVSRVEQQINIFRQAGMSDVGIIDEESYQELCKALGWDRIKFMGIS